jgi:outer membrane protein OmpA-like peptidoglycan-associated protein
MAIAWALPVQAGVAYRGTRGLIRARSADTIGKGILDFQLSGQYYPSKGDTLFAGGGVLPSNPPTDALVDYHFFITRGTLTYGLNEYAEASVNLEVRNWIRNPQEKNGHDLDVYTRGGIGDTQVSGKLAFPTLPHLKLGGYGEFSFPTGNEERRFTTNSRDFLVLGLATLDFTDLNAFVPTHVHVNAGYQWNRNETDGYGIFEPNNPDSSGFWSPAYPPSTSSSKGDSYNDEFKFNTAVEFPAPQVTIFVEFEWDRFMNIDTTGYNVNTYFLTPGVAIPFGEGLELKGAGDINLNSGDNPSLQNVPDWGVWLSISKSGAVIPQDQDGDGITDKDDQCPDQPEDLDGHEDNDGCPDLDNDGDGIPDAQDKCPDLAEDMDGFEDEDGCPDLDNDQDGVPDAKDRCPNEPEDFDGDQDEDGCPDLVKDSDNDGVPDDLDRCPLQAEDVDGFQDEDGCPDLDNDLDGIPDADDQCPNAPETFNGFEDEDGCPDERPIGQQFILQGVTFESGSAALTPDSYRVLDDVVRSLMAYPEVRVEIQGYTDSVGKASSNLSLSQRRADSVKQYLVNAGIDPSRLASVGFGEESPVASNSTPSGRAQNRRIEFKRLN